MSESWHGKKFIKEPFCTRTFYVFFFILRVDKEFACHVAVKTKNKNNGIRVHCGKT